MVSVCLATYNAEKFITATLESIRRQTYTDFEVIIVDDHSTDNTVNIILDFCLKDSRFKLFLNCTEEKYSDAHNLSYKYATGKYLFRIDNDDIYEPDYIGKVVEYMNKYQLDACSLSQDFYEYDGLLLMKPSDMSPDEYFTDATEFNIEPVEYYYKCCYFGKGYQHWHNNTSCLRKSFYDTHNVKYVGFGGGDGIFWAGVFTQGAKSKKITDIKVHKVKTKANTVFTKEYNTIDDISQYYSTKYYLSYFSKKFDKDTDIVNLPVLKNTFNYFKNKLKELGVYDTLPEEDK